MKRIEGDYIIEGSYDPRRYFNYVVYNKAGERAYGVGGGIEKPFWVSIAFEFLREAKAWIKNGCKPIIQSRRIVWAAHSDAVRKKLKPEGETGGKMVKNIAAVICPNCGHEMVRARFQLEDGSWMHCWLCECPADETSQIAGR